jgi:hypothetical protein
MVLGYQVIMFDVASDDWCGGDAATVAQQLEAQIHPGSILVLHDRLFDALSSAYFSRDSMIEAVGMLLARAGERYRFVTVPDLLKHGKAHRELWYQEPDIDLLNQLARPETAGRRYPDNRRIGRTIAQHLLGTQRR